MTEKEQFELGRELIRHEDGLLNNRVTWLLVLQGLLFGAFVNGAGLYEKNILPKISVTIGLGMLAGLGIVSSITAAKVISEATSQASAIRKWWKEILANGIQAKSIPAKDHFPPIAREWESSIFNHLFSTSALPHWLSAVWFTLIVLILVAPPLVQKDETGNRPQPAALSGSNH